MPVRRDASGRRGPTKAAARGPGWRRTSHGLYVPSGVNGGRTDQRIVEAAAVLPAGGADVRPQAGIAVSAESLGPEELTEVDGVPLTSAVRSVAFEMRHASRVRDAVVVADMAAYDDLISLAELGAFLESELPRTGIIQAREALTFARENAWSPQEVVTRFFWEVQLGLPQLLCNVPVFDVSGRHLVTPDLLDLEAGVVVDYNGEVHLDPARRRADRDREELFRDVGLELVEVVARDLAEPIRLETRMTRARAVGLAKACDVRRWTVDQPDWWTDTSTVEARRALSPYDRQRLLAYRRPAA